MTTERKNEIEANVYKILEANNVWVNYISFHLTLPLMYVEVKGDWKHDHLRCKFVMKEHGFEYLNEDVTEEDGSDFYTAVHYYSIPHKYWLEDEN